MIAVTKPISLGLDCRQLSNDSSFSALMERSASYHAIVTLTQNCASLKVMTALDRGCP